MIEVGQRATNVRQYSKDDITAFAAQAGIEVEKIDVIPEPLLAAQISYLLGVKLPGNGTMYLKQEMAFPAEAPLTEEITTTVKITELRPEKGLVDLWASCTTKDGTVVCEGRSLVMNKICWD
jgi:hypothetical protein